MGAVNISSAYLNVFSSERDCRRLCRSRELVSQRFTWDKLKRPKHIPEDFRLDAPQRSSSTQRWGAQELPVGAPMPPWESPPTGQVRFSPA